jgi:hypothetical protein
MTASPQATAEQARKNYRDVTLQLGHLSPTYLLTTGRVPFNDGARAAFAGDGNNLTLSL